MSRPLVIAHRGASAREPENSLAAFHAARALGADGIELDVHATADGHLVVRHDEMIGRHHVAHCSLREVREHRLANGEPVPTLEEALAAVLPECRVFVEIKAVPPKLDEALLALIDKSGVPEKIAVHSFDHRIVQRFGLLRPSLPRGVLSASYLVRPAAAMADADATTLWQHVGQLDQALVDAVHAEGGRVIAWTVDDHARMQELARMGVDGLCTNHPDIGRLAVDSLAS